MLCYVLKRGVYRCTYMKCYIQRSNAIRKTVIVISKLYLHNLIS